MAFSARGISKEYEHRPVLASVNLGLNPGDKIALVGSNGSGVIGRHQDDRFWGHWVGEVFTLWLALVDVDERMGLVRYVSPDLLDSYACSVLFGLPPTGVVV